MKGLHSTCEIRRVDGVEAPDAGVTNLVDARRDGADREQLLEVVDPVVAHADRPAEPLRPQRLQSAVLLQALPRVRRVDQVQVNIFEPQLAQRVSTGPNDRCLAKTMAREEFVVIQISSRCTSGRSFKKIASASPTSCSFP